MKKILLTALSVCLVSSHLAGCVPLVLGGAMAGGIFVATDRRTSGAQLEDEGLELRAAATYREVFGSRAHINATSYNRQILLTGEVPTAQDKALAEQHASKLENVKSVVNELAVLGNTSLTARSADTLVTSRVKAALVDDKELTANAFKIVTERGTVYMMGRVTKRESDKATEVIRRQDGVQRVVRVLELISEEELKRIQPAKSAAPEPTGPTPIFSGSGVPWNAQPEPKAK